MGYQKNKTARKRLWPEAPPPNAENINIVLVQPKRGTNVGAAARAMNNFGFNKLFITGEKKFDQHEAEYVAHQSEDIVRNAVYHENFEDALEGADLLVATTAREVIHRKSPETLKQAIPKIANYMQEGKKAAILFGPEWRGLSDDEVEKCSLLVTIPTGGPQPSLNLAQAVAIFCYELFCELENPPEKPVNWDIASSESLEGFWQHYEETLDYINFLPDTGKWRITYTLRDMLYRAKPDEREITILRGILRKLTWYLNQIPKKQREK